MIKIKNLLLGLLILSFAFTSCSKDDTTDDFDYGNHLPTNYPVGYYKTSEGKTNAELKTALYNVIKGHRVRTYSNLWTDFRSTDARPNGRVWDLYSDKTNYQFGIDQQTGSSGVVGRYNREHSFPKSWFRTGGNNDYQNTPMYTDLFHLYPSDASANEKRSNNCFYEVQNQSWTNGYCKLGTAVIPGNGQQTVFEPNDEIKGDLARTYFYFATRYENENLNSWAGSKAITRTKYPFFSGWQSAILLKWHRQDPVSDKEVKRNEAIYKIQGNRNPFIDCPDMAEYIWGSKMGQPYHETK